jgi:ubiquinone/menaquinone biosynthesis C-methylase UbiE
MGFYFNRIYNPLYDFIVGQVTPYHRLQETCIEKLELADGDKLLCAGIGTGNEILHILEKNPDVHITGIDLSGTALNRVRRKAAKKGASVETRLMDVQKLEFPDNTFDKVLCIHVTDFVKDSAKASAELLRVMKKNGKFAITFPSSKEDFSFGKAVIGDTLRHHFKTKRYYRIPLSLLSALVGGLVYFPFLFRKERRQYSREELEKLFSTLTEGGFTVEEFPVYIDFILTGSK